MVSLRRDRGGLALSFLLPVVFFSIFAVLFGGRRDATPKVHVLVVNKDHRPASERLVKGLEQEGSLVVTVGPEAVKGAEQPDYTAATAEIAVGEGLRGSRDRGHGFGESPISFGPADTKRPNCPTA